MAVPLSRECFDILLSVLSKPLFIEDRQSRSLVRRVLATLAAASGVLIASAVASSGQQPPIPASVTSQPQAATSGAPIASLAPSQSAAPRAGLSIVVIDPAHGGTDPGARGTAGIRESEVVMDFAVQARRALESQGFQVLQTRQGNENPSFDDRSALANAQRGAVFISLHVASTGLPGTVRVYFNSDLPAATDATGLIPWDRAQAPFLSLSHRLGDLVQGFLADRFKGSPVTAQTAAVRQLRTTAAPAIAVEVSSVTVQNRVELDHMAPGVADAIARGASAFRALYIVPAAPGVRP
ncbi:MAG: hypothetical protein C5B58_10455 [Acidobacteria bacterium]|nr:MAG: hypothetical protein C5B58_10455 [Acidobacteriota bacterium]